MKLLVLLIDSSGEFYQQKPILRPTVVIHRLGNVHSQEMPGMSLQRRRWNEMIQPAENTAHKSQRTKAAAALVKSPRSARQGRGATPP